MPIEMRGRGRMAIAAAMLMALALPAAGCGRSSGPGVANVGGASSSSKGASSEGSGGGGSEGPTRSSSGGGAAGGTTAMVGGGSEQQMVEYAKCMRSHGVPKFPDPSFSGSGVQMSIRRGSGIDPSSPQFQAAQKTCQGLMPGPRSRP